MIEKIKEIKKIVAVMIVIGIVTGLSGCMGSEKKVYYSEKQRETITVYPDNTITAKYSNSSEQPDYTWSGVWKMDKDEMIATWEPFGNVHVFKVEEDRLTDKDNNVWLRIRE